MLNSFKEIILLSAFSFLIICPAFGDWDYYGSGRDHAYSAYIDRANYVGPGDYRPIPPAYINGPLVFQYVNTPAVVTPVPPNSIIPAYQYTVNIPNLRGGYNAVVIKRSGEGFVGPQGEYYPEFPKIFQLQIKYGA